MIQTTRNEKLKRKQHNIRNSPREISVNERTVTGGKYARVHYALNNVNL